MNCGTSVFRMIVKSKDHNGKTEQKIENPNEWNGIGRIYNTKCTTGLLCVIGMCVQEATSVGISSGRQCRGL